jgi:hypothetical protein
MLFKLRERHARIESDNLISPFPYSSSNIELASGPKNGTSNRSNVAATPLISLHPYQISTSSSIYTYHPDTPATSNTR